MIGREDCAAVVVASGRTHCAPEAESTDVRRLHHVVERVAPLVDEVVVCCRRDQRRRYARALEGSSTPAPDATVQFARERTPGSLMAGLAGALHETDAPYVAVLSAGGRSPGRHAVASLFAAARDAGQTTVPVVKGRPQPLCAVYHREDALAACGAAIADEADHANGVIDHLEGVQYRAEPI
ncbi:molybdenum cofactor guanylyltransferase [Halarchaeum sp. P4]|uniref:molybdenum cofactor guanylyltransferase n=1 Tax=Halarchaeum sp. P4 TaxID=3421639 RepID=UPI003EB97BF5